MSKRGPTKAQQILNEARARVVQAEYGVTDARENLRTAEAVLKAQTQSFEAVEKLLASKPKKKP